MVVKAAIYVRISKDREGLELGVQRQEEDCRALAKRKGWEVGEVYSDNDISATSGKTRPAWERLLRDLESNGITAVVAYSSSRMYRRLRDLMPLLELAKTRKIKIATVASGDVNLTTADGRMMANILASVDQAEAERIGERIGRKMQELAEAGKDKGGPRPFGFEPDRVTIRESEAKLIRKAAKDRLAGKTTLRGIAKAWNEQRVPMASGKTGSWSGPRVKQILTSPRIAGLRQSGRGQVLVVNGEPVKAEWPAILDQESWLELRRTAKKRIGSGRERRHLLTGIVYCGRCGAKMEARTAFRNQPRAYVCRQCTLRIGADGLEEYIMGDVFPAVVNAEWIRRENARIEGSRSDPQDLRQRHTELSESLTSLARDHYVNRAITADVFAKMNAELTSEIEQLESQLSSTPGIDPYEGWETRSEEILVEAAGWTLEQKHAELAELISRVEIRPSAMPGRRGFDVERVNVVDAPPREGERWRRGGDRPRTGVPGPDEEEVLRDVRRHKERRKG